MCTNRLSSIDPAVKRRAAVIFNFTRPDVKQRTFIFERALQDTKISAKQLNDLVNATGPTGNRSYGYTYSDIMQRLLPNIIIRFFPDEKIDFGLVIQSAKDVIPSPPFTEESDS